VQPDLIGLEISKGELRRLTGFDADDVFRPSILKDKDKVAGFLFNEILVALALTPIIVGFIYAFIILPSIGSSVLLGILLLLVVPVLVLVGRWLWRRFTCPKSLTILLDEVDKYHQVVQAIDINDQLASSGNHDSNIHDREKIIAALQLIREDLVKALKTERILRDNKKLMANNQELFISNLATLQAFNLSNQAGEYAYLLNQSLQIAMDVQEQVRKLNSPP
jgi:ABC-type multidrug transport system fused ATPase/permease subunit